MKALKVLNWCTFLFQTNVVKVLSDKIMQNLHNIISTCEPYLYIDNGQFALHYLKVMASEARRDEDH